MKKIVCVAMLVCLFAPLVPAGTSFADDGRAREMGEVLARLFTPESITVRISEGGSFAWVEAKGAVIDKIRVDSLKLRALIKDTGEPLDKNDKYALAKLIMMSEGELTLLERDVNNLFKGDIETKGFSNLVFDFNPKGFTANGLFTAQFIFTIRIRLKAQGTLALHPDGIYVEKVKIFTEGIQQPDGLATMVTERINPLLSFEKIPFPVEFKKITMTEDAAILTGYPEQFKGGKSWSWNK